MHLLKTANLEWNMAPSAILFTILTLAFIILALFIFLKFTIRNATKEQRRQSKITNLLIVEQLKNQGVNEDTIHAILRTK
jgi:hypothetical protein